MEHVEMWKASDGRLFEDAHACEQYEQTLAANVLNPYVLAYDAEGRNISWADQGNFPMFALVRKIPTDEELEDKTLDTAWADYFDSDLEWELSRGRRTLGWWIKDPYQENWHPYEDWITEMEKLKSIMYQLKELPWG